MWGIQSSWFRGVLTEIAGQFVAKDTTIIIISNCYFTPFVKNIMHKFRGMCERGGGLALLIAQTWRMNFRGREEKSWSHGHHFDDCGVRKHCYCTLWWLMLMCMCVFKSLNEWRTRKIPCSETKIPENHNITLVCSVAYITRFYNSVSVLFLFVLCAYCAMSRLD